jgi:serine/threonine protein phosphatase 1
MAGRTFAIGDIHGDSQQLFLLLERLPALTAEDTLVFLGDYVDRGPDSAGVVEFLMGRSATALPAKLVALRGNHEDAWLRIIDQGWDGFISRPNHGCLATLRSFRGEPPPDDDEIPAPDEDEAMQRGGFLPGPIVEWFRSLPYWYEDEHALYVHAGLPPDDAGEFRHPRDVDPQLALLWCRNEAFFRNYRGKRVVFGHTRTECLPPELSGYTPEDPKDLWAGECVIGLDTGCGGGGFLTALEMPSLQVYESRN